MNIIKIKHGNGIPDGKLQPYELGICDDDGMLYIGMPPSGEEAYPLMGDYLSKYGGVMEGYLQAPEIDVLTSQENNYEGVYISSQTGIEMYFNYEDDTLNWDKGIQYYFSNDNSSFQHLGSINMTGTNESVECLYIGKNMNEAWLKIIPNVGIQADSIILKPYDKEREKGSYGYENPNDAGISGVEGQLYFVITE